jgi:ABC-2 type transport system ATP-binding protein
MIHVSELSKYFGGQRALGPLGFEIQAGESVGFLGLNGAGKTTLLRILACDLRPSGGSFRIGEVDGVSDPHGVRKLVGFLPELPPLYSEMPVGEYLRFAGLLRGMSTLAVDRRVSEVEERTHTAEAHRELLRNLSHGYRQRVGVAQAIIHEPELLILDEPTKGLDPAQIVEMRSMIRELKEKHTVLISSHVLPEIQETCDRLLVLRDGRLVASGTEQELSARLQSRRITVSVAAPGEPGGSSAIESCIRSVDGVLAVTGRGRDDESLDFIVEAVNDVRAAVCRVLVQSGYAVVRLDRADRELENVFLELVHGSSDAGR